MGVDQRKFYKIKRLETLEQEAQAQFLIAEALEQTLTVRVADFSTLLISAEEAEKRAQDHYNAAVDSEKKFEELEKLAGKAADTSNKAYLQMQQVFKQTYQVATQTVEVANATVRLAEVVQTQADKNPLISSFIQSQTGDTSSAATTAVKAILAALDKVALAMEDSFQARQATGQSLSASTELNPLIFYNLWERKAGNTFVPVSFLSLKFDASATVETILEEIRHLYVMIKDDRENGVYAAQQVEYDPTQTADLNRFVPLFHSLDVPYQKELKNVETKVIPPGTDLPIINETSSVMGIEKLLLLRLEKARKQTFERRTALKLAEKMLAVATKNLAIRLTAYEAAQEKLEAAKQAVNYPA